MSCLRSIATIILLHCVIEGLTIPHRGHHKKDNVHSDTHASHGSQLRRKQHVHVRHHSPQHATGAQRETVPSPVQDFVLLSGSPLFHERPRASDSKTNSTEATTPFAKSDQKEPQQTAANQTISKVQGQEPLSNEPAQAIQQQQRLNTSEQHPLPGFIQEIAQKIKEGVAAGQGKDQEKLVNSTNSNAPTITLETPAKANSSSGIVIGIGNASLGAKLNVDQEKTTGENASIVTISLNHGHEQKPDFSGHDKTNSTSVIEIGGKENHANASLAADIKPESQNQKPGIEHFPFNIPGLRHYGNEKNDNKAAEAPKPITEKETKLGLHENLGPNCHWKTSKGDTGADITSVSCSGEFHKPGESKGGLDEAGKRPPPGEVLKVGIGEALVGIKQINAENASVSGTGGGEKEIQMQSDKEFEDEAVVTTNAFRKIHRALPIKLNPELNREAKKYAEKIASMGSLQHDYDAVKHLDEGENLAMGCRQYGAPLTAKEAITNWYNEVCAYDFDRGEFSMSTGHFTQLAWSDSTEFGIGMARGEQNGMPCVFVVGRFKPSGNYKGEYKKNVFKGTFDPSYCDKLRDKKLL